MSDEPEEADDPEKSTKWVTVVQTKLSPVDEEEYKSSIHEWEGMPEFVQEEQREYRKIMVRFETEEAVKDFFNKINQSYQEKTRWIWYPRKEKEDIRRWVDENDTSL